MDNGELLLVDAGFNDKFSGVSVSLEFVMLLVVYKGGAVSTEPFVECAGNFITSTRSTGSRYSFDSL